MILGIHPANFSLELHREHLRLYDGIIYRIFHELSDRECPSHMSVKVHFREFLKNNVYGLSDIS